MSTREFERFSSEINVENLRYFSACTVSDLLREIKREKWAEDEAGDAAEGEADVDVVENERKSSLIRVMRKNLMNNHEK